MADKVLIYSRFPKTMMVRFAERFELLDTGGKPAREVFSADELGGIRAVLTAGGTPLGAEAMDLFPKLGAIVAPAMTASTWRRPPRARLRSATVRAPTQLRSPILR